jgi:hypothetical protein
MMQLLFPDDFVSIGLRGDLENRVVLFVGEPRGRLL